VLKKNGFPLIRAIRRRRLLHNLAMRIQPIAKMHMRTRRPLHHHRIRMPQIARRQLKCPVRRPHVVVLPGRHHCPGCCYCCCGSRPWSDGRADWWPRTRVRRGVRRVCWRSSSERDGGRDGVRQRWWCWVVVGREICCRVELLLRVRHWDGVVGERRRCRRRAASAVWFCNGWCEVGCACGRGH
jgi:hypothetical protein